jgi:ectoine hydroxylase-related dioxygenase (phytanoyl-CoA dioxygenase family)
MAGISPEDYEHWRAHGYVVVRLLDDAQVKDILDNVYDYFPSWEDYKRRPKRYDELITGGSGSLGPRREFPFVGTALNNMTVHPELVAFAERVTGTERLMLSHSQLIAKYPGTRDFEQELHVDYGNNSRAYPKPDTRIYDLPSITYYTDVTLDLGPTYLVPQDVTRDEVLVPRHRTREGYPELYEKEVALTVPAGSTVIYSMNTLHRGSTMRAREGVRFSHHIGLRRADVTWAGQHTFQHEGGRPEMDHWLEAATPRERELAGFPPVGDAFWDETTIAGVAARYPNMDMDPYRAG